MLIDFEERDDWLVARPDGARLDTLAAQEFTSAMARRCSGSARVVIDLVNVNFIDSRGLAALASIYKVLPTGGVLRLANASDQVEILLTMTRLNTLFPAFRSVEEAIAA